MGLRKEEVIISNRAKRSIREIYDYIKNREKSAEIAHYVRQSILEKCYELKDFSGYSKEPYLEEYPENYRSISIWSYIIIYVVKGSTIRVLNVVHGKQQPESRTNLK